MLFTDQLGQTIELKNRPKRIVSLVPSQTEFLYDLGLANEVVGITRFCIHPEELFKNKQRIGGTKTLDIQKILSLNPDLVIGNKEENDEGQIRRLMERCPVWMSDIKNLNEAYEMMEKIGEMTEKSEKTQSIISEIKNAFDFYFPLNHKLLNGRQKAAYLIWFNPLMSVNKDTFIHDIMLKIGFENVFAKEESRYPEISLDDLKDKKPDYILLSSEPFPFKEKHRKEIQNYLPDVKILFVDGELFSWYGSRLRFTPAYLHSLFGAKN